MAGLYGAARNWDLVTGDAVQHDAPAGIATGRLRSVGAGAIAAAAVLLLVTGFRFRGGTYGPMPPSGAGATQFAPWFYHDVLGVVSIARPPSHWFASALSPHAVFLVCHLLAMYACCFAVLRIVARLACADVIGLAAGALMIGVTYLDSGVASLSGETVVTGYFTTTQLATALVALSLAFALDGSLAIAVGLLGLAFDAESAVALWGVAGLVGTSVALPRDGEPVGRAWATGGVCALGLAAPSIVWWAREFGNAGLPGDYLGWLGVVEPSQILPWPVPLERWVLFGSGVVLGLAAFSVLGSNARPAFGAFVGFLTVFAVGCFLPLLTDSQWLAILRPMEVDTLLQLLAAAAAIAVVLHDVRGGGGLLRVALSVAIAACLLLHRSLLPLAALAMLTRAAAAHGELLGLERRIRDCNQVTQCRVALIVVVAAGLAGGLALG